MMSEQSERKLNLGEPPTYPFGINDDYFKKLKPDGFEVFDEKKPFEFVIENPVDVVAEICVLAHSGYDAIKLVAKICPGYTYRFADCHFDCQRKALEALWEFTRRNKHGGHIRFDKMDGETAYATSSTLNEFIDKIAEVDDE